MKWIKNKQKIDKKDWHLWFAWKPVIVSLHSDGNEEKVWMETLLRRFVYDISGLKHGIGGFWKAEYKYLPDNHKKFIKDEPEEAGTPIGAMIKIDKWTEKDEEDLRKKVEEADPQYLLESTMALAIEASEEAHPDMPETTKEAMKEAFRATMTPDKPKQYEIITIREVINARRNKTIM